MKKNIEKQIIDLQNYLVSLGKEKEFLQNEIKEIEEEEITICRDIRELENELNG
jgi:chromosome segregation ATPase